MRFGKLKMFLFLNGLIVLILLFYFLFWWISGKTVATIVSPFSASTITVQYKVNNKIYTGRILRGNVPFDQKQIFIRYSLLKPSAVYIPTFLGLYAEPLAWWLVFLIASAMLLLMPNTVFSKGTMFQLQKKFPWISMDEYFPVPGDKWYRERTRRNRSMNSKKRLEQKDDPKTLTS
jgi:hypothetical protein